MPGIQTAMRRAATWLRRDDRGATAVEYALIVALVAAVIAGVVATLGTTLVSAFQNTISGF